MKYVLVLIWMTWNGIDNVWVESRQTLKLPDMVTCEYLLRQKSFTNLSTDTYRYIGGYCEATE